MTRNTAPESLPRAHRLTAASDFAALRSGGRAHRGAHCLAVAQSVPGEPTKVGFVASRKAVGGAVRRNRARRRLREIVRRRWPRVRPEGLHVMFVAFGSAVTAPHAELVGDVERLLERVGLLRDPGA